MHRVAVVGLLAVGLGLSVATGSDLGPLPEEPVAAGRYPLTVDSCGEAVTISSRPHDVMVVGREAASLVRAAGGVDQVTTVVDLAGEPTAERSDASRGAVRLTVSADGADVLSAVEKRQPDLVVVPDLPGLPTAALASAGSAVLVLDSSCPAGADVAQPTTVAAAFDRTSAQVEALGRALGTGGPAAVSVAALREQAREAAQAAAAGQ